MPGTLTERAPVRAIEPTTGGRLLRMTSVVFAAAVLIHGVDHLRRGIGVITGVVLAAGTVQAVAAGIAVLLVFRGHRLAAAVAAAVGLQSAIGFTASHLLPQWSALSDPFVGAVVAPRVTAFSWFAALFEIAADLAFGFAALVVLRARHR
jgi:hypothetical protein